MANKPERIDQTIAFWDHHSPQLYLIEEKSLSLFDAAIEQIRHKVTFSLEHVQAFVLAVSLCEGQIRDCIRLAIDAPFMEIDADNPLIKEVKLDFTLIKSVRERRFSLGEFFALNTSISTVGRFWSGAALGFPGYNLSERYASIEGTKLPAITFDEIKASLASVFAERNRYVHEFSDRTAASVGVVYDTNRTVSALEHVSLLLRFFQLLKTSQYGGAYNESHPSRGEVGKKLNAISKKIRDEISELDSFLRNSQSVLHYDNGEDVRKAIQPVQTALNEYLFRLSTFIYYAMGPGTLVNDFIYGAHLAILERFDRRIVEALQHQMHLRTLKE